MAQPRHWNWSFHSQSVQIYWYYQYRYFQTVIIMVFSKEKKFNAGKFQIGHRKAKKDVNCENNKCVEQKVKNRECFNENVKIFDLRPSFEISLSTPSALVCSAAGRPSFIFFTPFPNLSIKYSTLDAPIFNLFNLICLLSYWGSWAIIE